MNSTLHLSTQKSNLLSTSKFSKNLSISSFPHSFCHIKYSFLYVSQAEVALSDLMMSAWHSMAVTTTPRLSPHSHWPEWTPESNFGAEFTTQGSSVRPMDESQVCNALEDVRMQSRAFLARVRGGKTDGNDVVGLSSL